MPNYVPIQDLVRSDELADTDYVPVSDGSTTFAVLASKFKDFQSGAKFEKAFGIGIEEWEGGGIINGVPTTSSVLYRVHTKNILTASRNTTLIAANGFQFIVYLYSGTTYQSNSGIRSEYTITSGSNFRVAVLRFVEDTSEIANVSEFSTKVIDIGSLAYTNGEPVQSAISSLMGVLTVEFVNGGLPNGSPSTNSILYRVFTANIITTPRAVTLKAKAGFQFIVYYYNGSTYQSNSGVQTEYTIASGSQFRVLIRRIAEDTTEVADVELFRSKVFDVDSLLYHLSYSDSGSTDLITQSRLYQKKMNIIGDSYVANNGQSVSYTWHYKIALKYEMTYRNYGINGNPMVADVEGRGTPVVDRYTDMDNDADYIIVVAGKNDYNVQLSLSEFRAGVATLIEGLTAKYIGKKICFFTPWYVPQTTLDAVGNPGAIPLTDYCDAIAEVCKVYSVPCFKSYNSGLATYNQAFRTAYFQSANDISHLSDAGHDFFEPKAESFLLNL